MKKSVDNVLVYNCKARKINLKNKSILVSFVMLLACGFMGSAQANPITFLVTDTGGDLSGWFTVDLTGTAEENVSAIRSSDIVSAAVPEPSAIALIAFSLVGVGVMRRRQV